jgi:hypothetical protein
MTCMRRVRDPTRPRSVVVSQPLVSVDQSLTREDERANERGAAMIRYRATGSAHKLKSIRGDTILSLNSNNSDHAIFTFPKYIRG